MEDGEDAARPSGPSQCGHEDQRYRCLVGPTSCCSSQKSAASMEPPLQFPGKDRIFPTDRCLSIAASMEPPLQFAPNREDLQSSEVPTDPSVQQHQTQLDSIFMLLEENIVTFVKNELKKIQKVLSPDDPECSEGQSEDEEVMRGEDEEQRRSSREAVMKITLNFLRKMKQEELADRLQSKLIPSPCQHKLKSNLKKKFQCVFEGIAKAGSPALLNQIYTELYITEGRTGEVNQEHEVRQIETTSRKPHRPETTIRQEDIFKVQHERDQPIRTVMTKGVAGIGKTVLTQKFTLDWAEDKTNQNIQFIFPFTFRELNVLKEKKFSLVELIHHFFTETKGISNFEQFQVLFIFDGLDESRLPLDFHNKEILTDATESSSVDVLLTNLIRGKLLPSALLWITTRPAAANQIPPQCVCLVTEVRGFNDPQKEEYFRKRFRDEKQTRMIISHLKTVHLTFINSGVNLLEESLTEDKESALANFHQSAVDKAVESPNGHLDLFLRFLLGLSLQANQRLLQGLLTQKARSLQKNQETVQYIKQKISDNVSVDKSINLLYCLNELKDCSLQEEIRKYLKSGSLSTDKLSPAQWSALVFILLSSGKDLDEFDLKKYSASEEALLRLLPVVKAAKKAVLSGCNLSARSCEALSSVLSSQSSSLRELDLSNNDLEDSGIKQLCHGLESPCCKLETLSLSGCLVSEEGCSSLASALISNPSHLRELDLSYNHPGESGLKLLSVSQKRPDCRLDTIRAEPGSVQWLKPNFRKYFCELTLDPNTAHKFLKLSENNRKVTDLRKEHPHPDHPERFDYWPQVLCETDLTGRCYWEVEWVGKVYVAVSYRGIGRNGDSDGSKFGGNDQSWCLACTDGGYSAWHNNSGTPIPLPSSPAPSHRVGVYVDCPAGILSFCRVSGDVVTHLHSFSTTFTEPLYAGFGYGVKLNSSALLCQL
ncbi:NACHT, LRR and PYD domains-containing protein 3-like [Poecilia latipinna]|uniref:NACHT, LRR and PYD domains-containing protein 3-like n=1 Tax=Poecilia latipinna TaxID=48699 RepID=UPI00072DAD35|nr:PREDICTED: NACHT, LRR and PYD domains-containing protein 3-like [Poecilia latipinna]